MYLRRVGVGMYLARRLNAGITFFAVLVDSLQFKRLN